MDHPVVYVIPWILLLLGHVKQVISQTCPAPSLTTLTDNGCIQLQSIPQYTQTAGSTITYTCAGLITGLVSTYPHCPVELCKADFTWTSPSISCGTNECYNVGSSVSYLGHRTCTMNGKICQRWDSQTPHSHSFTGANFPDATLNAANNYCRDPDGSGYPWCFTTDPLVGKESCSVLQCSTVPTNYGTCTTTATLDPTGTTAANCGLPTLLAMTDNGCIQLQSIPPYTTTAGSIINYICAGLLTGFVSSYDHCPEQLCQTTGLWTSPTISCGINECYTVGSSSTYQGHRTCTFSGKTCQRWDSQTPHSHSFTAVNFPDGSLALANNYCRDPDGTGSPWCYTTDAAVVRESCNVLVCTSVPVNEGTCTTATTAPTVAMTTTVTTTAIAPATSVTKTAPKADLSGDKATFSQRQQGSEKYTNIRNVTGVSNSIRCGRECLVEVNCDLFIFDEATRVCNLSQEDPGAGISINCSANNCFKLQRETLIYNTVA